MQSATFAGVMDFDGPQPFNVELAPEPSLYPVARFGQLGRRKIPVVRQEITPDRDLYPRRRHGVVVKKGSAR